MTNWTPTDNQLEALRLAEKAEWKYTVGNLCQDVGISRAAYYQWFDTPGFVEWWGTAVDRWFTMRMPGMYGDVLEAVRMEGSKRNISAAKLLAERFDKRYVPRSRQDVSADVAVKTYINVDVDAVTGVVTEADDE